MIRPKKIYFDKYKKGFTLVEIMVASFVVVLIVVGIALFVTYFFQSYSFSFEENQAIGEAERAIRVMTKELREVRDGEDGSYPLAAAEDQQLIFYADVDNDDQTERVVYLLTGTTLMKYTYNSISNPPEYPCADGCTICHKPGENDETITIPESAWPAHQGHGDYIGTCEEGSGVGGLNGGEADTEQIVAENIRNGFEPVFYYYNGDWPGDMVNNPLASGSRLLNTKMVNVSVRVNVNPIRNPSDFSLSTFVQLRNLKTNL